MPRSLSTNARRLLGAALGWPLVGPRVVSLEVTHGCNLRCAFCESHGIWQKEPITATRTYAGGRRTMDLATVTRLARDLRREGTELVELSGKGEPTTHPQFVEFVRAIRGAGLECALVTNGTSAPPGLVEAMVDLRFNRLTVSLNAGSPEVYERVGGRPHWDRAVGFLRATLERRRQAGTRLPWTRISHVVCKENFADLDRMVGICRELKVDEVVWCVLGELPVTRHLRLDPAEVASVRERAPVWARQLTEDGIEHNLLAFAGELSTRPDGAPVQQNPLQRRLACYEAWRFCVIGPDGAVVPCCYCEEEVLGNVFDDGFRAVWRGKRYQDLRRRMLAMPRGGRPICGECFTNCNRAQDNLHVHRRIHPFGPRIDA